MTYSELRKQQDREIEDLLIERLDELEKFRKMNSENWAIPDKHDQDIERTKEFYARRIKSLREQHQQAQKAFLGEPEEEQKNIEVQKDWSNPIDKSTMNNRYDKEETSEVDSKNPDQTSTDEQPKEKKKFRYRRRMK